MSYHSVYTEHGLRRSRRLPCFTVSSLLASATLGLLVGTAVTATWLGARQPVAQHAVCLLRGQDTEGLLPARYAPLTGVCEVRK